MLSAVWQVAATPAASVCAGLALLVVVWVRGLHRDSSGRTTKGKIATAVLQGAVIYTVSVTVAGHWIFGIPVSRTIGEGFGNDRFAWLLLGVVLDSLRTVSQLFDPD